VIVAQIMENKNARTAITPTGEFGDLFQAGIIDPTKSPRRAAQFRSAIGLALTTDVLSRN